MPPGAPPPAPQTLRMRSDSHRPRPASITLTRRFASRGQLPNMPTQASRPQPASPHPTGVALARPVKQNHLTVTRWFYFSNSGGGRGIRTPGRLAPSTVFKTAAINRLCHSSAAGACAVRRKGCLYGITAKNTNAFRRPFRRGLKSSGGAAALARSGPGLAPAAPESRA